MNTMYADVRPPAWRLKAMAEAGTLPAGWILPGEGSPAVPSRANAVAAPVSPVVPAAAPVIVDTRSRSEKMTVLARAHGITEEVLSTALAEGQSVEAFALEVAAIVGARREVDEMVARITAA